MEACWVQGRQDAPDVICSAACTECCLVVGFLPLPSTRLGVRGDRGSVAGDRGNNNRILQNLEDRRLVDGAVPGVGELRECVELRDLAVELKTASQFAQSSVLMRPQR